MRDIRTMLAQVHHGETLRAFKLFAQPVDQAEVLHTRKYDISGSWKNSPGEHEFVLLWENTIFLSDFATYVQPYLPLNVPAVTKNITLQEARPSLRVICV